MNIENHIHNSKTCLDCAREKIAEQDYDTALALLVQTYTNTRALMDHVLALKACASEAARSAKG